MMSSDPSSTTESTGRVAECWRYPVKSFQGLRRPSIQIGPAGVDGDRTFGLIDLDVDRLLSAKRTAALLEASASDTSITLPDGTELDVDDPGIDAALTDWIGRPVHFAQADGTAALSYQMTFDPPDDEAEMFDIPAPVGTFLDLAHVHLMTTASLRAGAEARPDLDWDVRRFRPNLLVDVQGSGLVEHTWIGRRVRVGEVVLSIDSPTVRCAMPLRAQPAGLERQPGLFKALNDLNETFPNHLGIYCSVVSAGAVNEGDPVTLI